MVSVWEEFFRYHPVLLMAGVISFLVSACLMQRLIAAFTISRMTIPSVFYLTYLIMIFFPSFWVFVDHPGPYREAYLIAVISVLLTVPLGIFHANKMLAFTRKETDLYFTAPVIDSYNVQRMFHVHVVLVILALLVFVAYMIDTPVLPIVQLIKNPGETLALTMAREESFKMLDPRHGGTKMFYAYLFLRTLLFPVLVLTTLGYYLFTRQTKWLALFTVVALTASFYAVSSLSRAPMAAIIMRTFFFLFLFSRARLSKRAMMIAGLLMATFPILVTTFAYSSEYTLLDGILAVGVRLTYTPAEDLYYYFEIFPTVHDYLYGHTLVKPILKFLGEEYFYIENFVALYISPGGVQSAHANAAFVSNLHADFGFAGVLVGGFIVGFFIQALHVYLARQEKNVLNIATAAFIVYAIWVLNFGSITSVLIVNGVLPVFALVFAIRAFSWMLAPYDWRIRTSGRHGLLVRRQPVY